MKNLLKLRIQTIAFVLVICLNTVCFALLRWEPQIVDADGDVGLHNAIAVDAQGKAHISYYDASNGNLKYAENTSGVWTVETVESSGNVGQYSAIAIDLNGSVHISYHHSDNRDLKYATNASGAWVSYTVDSAGDVGKYTSIKVDLSGMVHISYYDESNKDLKYARGNPGGWTVELVDGNNDAGSKSSIAVDSIGRVHISYCAIVGSYEQRYAVRTDNSWAVQTVATGAGRMNNLVLDSSGNVKICYNFFGYYSGYRVVSNASGTWVVEREVSVLTYAGYWHNVQMALDVEDNVYVYFVSRAGDHNVYTNNCGDWLSDSLYPMEIGINAAFVVDSKRNVHISSYDSDAADILYSTNISTPWQTETIDCFGDTGKRTDLAVDDWGNLHVIYKGSTGTYEDAPGVLKYATNSSGVWINEIVDSDSISIYETSLVLDLNGNVHVVYNGRTDAGSGFVRYATNTSGSWNVERIMSSDIKGLAIALDSRNNAHISYGINSLTTKNYVNHAVRESGSWNIERVFDGGYVSINDTVIRIDSQDNVHIAHSNGDYLRHATKVTGSWVNSIVDNIGGNGGSLSMVLDSSGTAHLSYVCKGLPTYPVMLSYAYGTPGAWTVWRLDPLGNMWHEGTSIALDAADKVHISYFNDDADNLMYITNAPGRWIKEEVDSGSYGMGIDNAIGIDANGRVHISYYDEFYTNLKYAFRPDSSKFSCVGDFDGSGNVDENDLSTFALNFGLNGVSSKPDIDNDSDVDGWDLFEMILDYNRGNCLQ